MAEESKDQPSPQGVFQNAKLQTDTETQILKPTNKYTQGALHILNQRDIFNKLANTRKKVSYTSKLSKFKSNLFEKANDIGLREVRFDPKKNMVRSHHNSLVRKK